MLGSIIDALCFFWPYGKKEKTIYLEEVGLVLDKELSSKIEMQFGDVKIKESIIPLFNLIGALREDKRTDVENKKELSINIIHHLGDINLKSPKHRYSLLVVVNSAGQIFIVKIETQLRYGRKSNTITDVSIIGKYKIWNSKTLLTILDSDKPLEMDLEIVSDPNGCFLIAHGIKFFYVIVINWEDIDKEFGIVQETTSKKKLELKEFGYEFTNYSIAYETRQRHTIRK